MHSDNLKMILYKMGKKQVEVCKEVGCSLSVFSKYVNGWIELPSKYEQKFCDFLGMTPEQLHKVKRERNNV